MNKLYLFALIFTLCLGSGCANTSNTGKGAMYGTAGGAAAGALLGQAIGGNSKSTALGAAIGAAVGGIAGAGVGNMMDRQEREMREALAASQAVNVERQGQALDLSFNGDITFDTNSATIRSGLYPELDRVSQILVNYPQTTILVEGHTDNTGKAAYNQTLSEKRAASVRNAFMQRGVDGSRITAVGRGQTMPIADNSTAEGRRLNRRVDVHITPNAQ